MTDDDYQPPCYGNPAPFDAVLDRKDGPAHNAAVRVCRDICSGCDLKWKITCLRTFADHPSIIAGMTLDERDVASAKAAGRQGRAKRRCEVEGCYEVHRAKGMCQTHYHEQRAHTVTERTVARAENLRELIAAGATLDEVCARLHVGREALYKWCYQHGHHDLWRALKPPQPEALVKVRRRGAA